MRLMVAATALLAAVAWSVVDAHAQTSGASKIGQHSSKGNTQEKEEPVVKANEKAYNSALKNIPDKQYDPWRGVR